MGGFTTALGMALLSALGLVITSFMLASTGRQLRDDEIPPTREEMRSYLVYGLIYMNPLDPRGWVPKIRGVGWTVNARTRGGAITLLLFTIATILFVIGAVIGAVVSFLA